VAALQQEKSDTAYKYNKTFSQLQGVKRENDRSVTANKLSRYPQPQPAVVGQHLVPQVYLGTKVAGQPTQAPGCNASTATCLSTPYNLNPQPSNLDPQPSTRNPQPHTEPRTRLSRINSNLSAEITRQLNQLLADGNNRQTAMNAAFLVQVPPLIPNHQP
jgi:hypothetical protein